MSHANVALSPATRLKIARLVVEGGWPVARVAGRFQCSSSTVSRWANRYRRGEVMTARSSRPHASPNRTPTRLERRIIALRFTRRWGPHRIGYHLRIPRSTVGRVLTRYGMPLLTHVDQATGLPTRRPTPIRFEMTRPGELVHVDIKKLGRIPSGGGWRKLGRTVGKRHNKKQPPGYAFMHHAVDGYSRLVYSEILDDERRETASAFWRRASSFFADAGITVTAVMTDNGSCYRSHAFRDALDGIQHRFTRPYRPQTNGKVERFNRTLANEWAYAQTYSSEAQRVAAYDGWLHNYNHHRPHTALGGLTPAERVRNVTGKNN